MLFFIKNRQSFHQINFNLDSYLHILNQTSPLKIDICLKIRDKGWRPKLMM